MSHVAKMNVKMTNVEALTRAAKRLGAIVAGKGIAKFYDNTEVGGIIIQLPGWQYSVVAQESGNLVYDNYNGEWGSIDTLNQLKQLYAVEVAKLSAEQENYTYQEEVLPSGVLKVTIEV